MALPDLIDEYLEKAFGLADQDSRKFNIAATWFSQVPELWTVSSSSAFVAIISAVEVLIEKKSETCGACGQPKFSVTRKFKAFLEEHLPDVQNKFPEELQQIYGVRLDLAHGGDLLLSDLEYWNFFGKPRQQWQDSVQWNAHEIAGTALLNWLLKH